MNYDYEIQSLKKQIKNLTNSIFTMSSNNADEVKKRENTSNQVLMSTPYTETKTAYLEDTEVQFSGVKDGNLSVYVKDENGGFPNYTVERNADIITVYFEPLEYITTITISIQ